jgi:Ala-tRNA(Pro) deacylase
MYEKLAEFLGSMGAEYEVVTHSPAMTAQEQAATSHTPGGSAAKVVIVKERDGLALAVLPAASVLDLNRLKGLIGHGEIRLADAEEIRSAVPDCLPGSIPPFGRLFGLPTFVDRALLRGREVTMPAGDFQTSLRMRAAEFRRLAVFREGDFARPER